MGFPRILSKNNKIYTKLGDFCLSGDGHNFWILCHTCQQELQTQDQFWKHIQDEHNFLQGLKQEHSSNIETGTTSLIPIPLYRKGHEDEQSTSGEQDNNQQQTEHKNYTEIRAIEPNNVDINIKVEPQLLPPPSASQLGINATQTLYQLPQVPPVSAYATIVHTPTLPALNMSMVAPATTSNALLPQELPKDSNSTTASASSAISSEDGERWYICDYETCGLRFKYQSRLELHRAVHSKERRFACELCGASFKQSCNLSTHRKKKHFLKGSKGLVQQHY